MSDTISPGATQGFKQQVKAAFEGTQVGQTFTFRCMFTEGDVALFCGVTGDYKPYHIDSELIRFYNYRRV